jgi:phosphoribosylformylglycinamidine synthase
VDLDVARVPRRETGLGAFEVMLSESQERMLLLVRAGREAAIQAHFARWELHAAIIGEVMAEPAIRVRDEGEVVAELPIALLIDDVPAYDLVVEAPLGGPGETSPMLRRDASLVEADGDEGESGLGAGMSPMLGRGQTERSGEAHADFGALLLRLLASPNLRSRRFAFRQYDSTVQGNTALGPGHAAAVVRVEGTSKGLAIVTDCNPRLTRLDPRRGAMQAVAESARNLACVGAEPIAVTDCLNFGNPEKPRVGWQLTEAIAGLSEACRSLGVPIVSGNVSLYNEASGRAIPPTPTVGMVGLLDDVRRVVPTRFDPDRVVVLLGEPPTRLGASELQPEDDAFPRFDLDSERRLGALLRDLAGRGLVRSAQDVSDGGLAVALAECALLGECGAILQLEGPSMLATLFSEDQGRAVVTCDAASIETLVARADAHEVAARHVGRTGGDRLRVESALDVSLGELRAAWEPAL